MYNVLQHILKTNQTKNSMYTTVYKTPYNTLDITPPIIEHLPPQIS